MKNTKYILCALLRHNSCGCGYKESGVVHAALSWADRSKVWWIVRRGVFHFFYITPDAHKAIWAWPICLLLTFLLFSCCSFAPLRTSREIVDFPHTQPISWASALISKLSYADSLIKERETNFVRERPALLVLRFVRRRGHDSEKHSFNWSS